MITPRILCLGSRFVVLALLFFLLRAQAADTRQVSPGSTPADAHPEGMVWIPGGEFTMGTDDPRSFPN
jgi:formylglycine-generating enzyme required for sulfatase activity